VYTKGREKIKTNKKMGTFAFGIIITFALLWTITKIEKIEKNTEEIIGEIKDLKDDLNKTTNNDTEYPSIK